MSIHMLRLPCLMNSCGISQLVSIRIFLERLPTKKISDVTDVSIERTVPVVAAETIRSMTYFQDIPRVGKDRTMDSEFLKHVVVLI